MRIKFKCKITKINYELEEPAEPIGKNNAFPALQILIDNSNSPPKPSSTTFLYLRNVIRKYNI